MNLLKGASNLPESPKIPFECNASTSKCGDHRIYNFQHPPSAPPMISRRGFPFLLYFTLFSICLYFIYEHDMFYDTLFPKVSITSAFWKQKFNNSYELDTEQHQYILNLNLWRPTDEFPGKSEKHYNDRILEQNLLARSLRPTQKKRIALPDGFGSVFETKESVKESLRINCPNLLNYCDYFDSRSNKKDARLVGVDVAIINYAVWHTVPPGNYTKAYFLLESSYLASATLNGTDLLCSFWSGSDIAYPYGKWVNYTQPRNITAEIKKNYAKGKSKMAAIFTSNCGNVHNGRMEFVNKLKKFGVLVDVYGKCGNLSCARQNATECFSMLRTDYKFYLAIENSNCRDYITEKFFRNALENDIVPVVMGAPLEDFYALAPLNAYIHVDTFGSVQALAKHLLFLDKNDTEYNRYFEWKGTGELVDPNFFCRFCGMMYYADYVPFPVRRKTLYYGMQNAGRNNQTTMPCLPRNKFYWNSTKLT